MTGDWAKRGCGDQKNRCFDLTYNCPIVRNLVAVPWKVSRWQVRNKWRSVELKFIYFLVSCSKNKNDWRLCIDHNWSGKLTLLPACLLLNADGCMIDYGIAGCSLLMAQRTGSEPNKRICNSF